MDYKYIEQLLERFWNCQTSLEEEAILKSFFKQKDIPAKLARYKALFDYGNEEQSCKLGDDFDEKMLKMVGESKSVKAKIIPLRQRLMPLFKAAAMVAIILTLGNAAQMAFDESSEPAQQDVALTPHVQQGPSVAMGDSVKIDTLKKSTAMSGVLK